MIPETHIRQYAAMKFPFPSRRESRGFTLIELMVVIVILGILMSITFPAINKVMFNAQKTRCKSDAIQLRNAITSYYTEYRKYPIKAAGGAAADRNAMPTTEALMGALLAADSETVPGGLNPRGTAFFSTKAAKPAGGGRYAGGIHMAGGGNGSLWDPWGNNFLVTMDSDYNNRVELPSWETRFREVAENVVVWSPGRDRDDNQSTDNVMTWE